MAPQIQTIIQELRAALEALYGARLKRLVLYGSHARGDAIDDSDIDVMVVLDGPVRPGEEIRRMGWIRTRSYYAMFFAARALYLKRNISLQKSSIQLPVPISGDSELITMRLIATFSLSFVG